MADVLMEHALKVEPPYFDALASGVKPFEVRRNDRAFQRGDRLLLREWHDGRYTGREVRRLVTYVYAGDPRWPHSLGLCVVVLGLAVVCTSCDCLTTEPPCCRNPEDGSGFHTTLSGVGAGLTPSGGPDA